eukprot:GCRY01003099.1.p1 GENE.GCRY01003099.1~~GCRY01003099.1.p1  ORF type:complete len:215 (-),score=23.24 GCRY01003099.1:313-957(-)
MDENEVHEHLNSPTMEEDAVKGFDCNICLSTASDPVVTMCGHLYCWPCIYQWMNDQKERATCPVCKAVLSPEKCIPLYGRGSDNHFSPPKEAPNSSASCSQSSSSATANSSTSSESIPHRPSGQREDPPQPPPTPNRTYYQAYPPQENWGGLNFGFGIGGIGLGLFPPLVGFQWGTPFHPTPPGAHSPNQQDEPLSRMMMMLGIMCLMYIMFYL